MARARNIKPAFFLDERLAELRFEVRLLCAGLPTLADREGRLEDRPKWIKAQLFAYDNVNVDKALADLARIGRIVRYEIEGIRYIYVSDFLKDQNPHVREPASTIPPPPSTGAAPDEALTKHEASTGPASANPEPARLIPDSPSLIPDSGLPLSKTTPSESPTVSREPTSAMRGLGKTERLKPSPNWQVPSLNDQEGLEQFAREHGVNKDLFESYQALQAHLIALVRTENAERRAAQ